MSFHYFTGESYGKNKRTKKDNIEEIVAISRNILGSITSNTLESKISPVNSTFAKFVAMRLDEIDPSLAKEKRIKIINIIEK